MSSGLPLVECSWRIKADIGGEAEDGILPSGNGTIDGMFCTINETIDGKNLLNGRYYLEVTAKDVAGRVVNEKGDKRFSSNGYFAVVKDPPEVEIVKPAENDYFYTSFVEIAGTVKNPELIDSIEYTIRGVEKNNEGSKASSRAIVDKNTGNWDGAIGQNMPSGRYFLELIVTDIYGNQRALERREFTLDYEAPIIKGAKEGVLQKPYLQEGMAYNQRFIDEAENPRYIVEPAGSALPISWSKKAIIQRWSTRIDDNRTAPVYAVKVKDDNKLKEVRYSIAAECAPLTDGLRVADEKDERYEFPLIQSLADVDLSQDSAHDIHQKYCLSIWAIDQAGHASNHTVEFSWKVITPPVSVDMNTTGYRANRSDDDITSVNKTYSSMFLEGDPLKLLGNIVIGHAVITNPHSTSIFPSFDLKKPMYLKLNSNLYYINQNKIKIKYFSYDLVTGKIGSEVELIRGKTMLKSSQAVLVKFILMNDFAFKYPAEREKHFWKNLNVETGFNKTESAHVDGLLLSMLDAHTGRTLSEFMVPWGESHYVRKRTASRFVK